MTVQVQRGRRNRWAVVLALLLLYALSVGPAVFLVNATGEGRGVVRVAYLPHIWLHDYTPLKEPLEWYVEPWQKAGQRWRLRLGR
jgi:hypothetical protein